jgi:pantoate--beta-alanine ligase
MHVKCYHRVLARQRMTKQISQLRQRRPRVIRSLPVLKRTLGVWRARRQTIALVPTMGALHAGHIRLVRLAQRRADRVIVSIFVNPSQFAPGEDLNAYPRTFAADLAALADLKADLVWTPPVNVMYPSGFASRIVPEGPATVGLEDAYRPHFFGGVATIVAKLLIQCDPDVAIFGEKDYQQLKVVTRLARDLDLKVRIVGAPVVREADGLALSSRNRYLSAGERAAAPVLYRVLKTCAAKIAVGKSIAGVLDKGRATITEAGFVVDYLEACDVKTLARVTSAKQAPIRLLVAARLGKTRLIDNVPV